MEHVETNLSYKIWRHWSWRHKAFPYRTRLLSLQTSW